ncbi:MAG: hypothetical protein KCHDKBKB_02448 [Elusimicrobia bacterium]|nr:hypothetical protein [Elusimicrobiota bacterium]
MRVEITTVVLMLAVPLLPPTPSNTTVCDDAGTPPETGPPLEVDQLLASFQLPAPVEIQYRLPLSGKRQLVLLPKSTPPKLLSIVIPRDALE